MIAGTRKTTTVSFRFVRYNLAVKNTSDYLNFFFFALVVFITLVHRDRAYCYLTRYFFIRNP